MSVLPAVASVLVTAFRFLSEKSSHGDTAAIGLAELIELLRRSMSDGHLTMDEAFIILEEIAKEGIF